jgi:hypothetical protein
VSLWPVGSSRSSDVASRNPEAMPLPCPIPAALALLLLLLAVPPADACASSRLRSATTAPRAERSGPPQKPVRPVVRAGGRGRG